MKLDWDRGHGPVTGPINAAAAILAASWAGNVADMPWQVAALTAGTGLIGTHIAGRRKQLTRSSLALRAATWLGAGGWASWAVIHGPWTQWGIGTLAAGAIGAGIGITGARHAEKKAEEKKEAETEARKAGDLDAKRQAIATEWADRIKRVCSIETTIVGVDLMDTDTGFTLDGDIGPGGDTWKNIKAYEEALAADARLPEGCGVEVGPGANRGSVLLIVTTANKLIEDIDYPDDYSPLSINDPAALGVHRDGTKAAPVMRQLSATFVGRRGSGKTNLMNVSLGNQCRMVDNLAWVIDLNGGGLALAWLHKWQELGRPGRPPVDWVADTPEKALALAEAALRIAKARKPGYKKRELAANDDKLPVGADVPAITINNDEIAELFSAKARRNETLKKVGDTLIQIQELARAVAVNTINAALRATQDVISEPQLLVQSGLKIGMKSDEREMNYLFGWDDRITPEDIPYAGCGAMKIEDAPARPMKVYRMRPDQMAKIIEATSSLRPELDELSRKAAGEAYDRRWDGTDHLFGIGNSPVPVQQDYEEETTQPAPSRGSGVTAGWGTQPPSGDIRPELDRADDALRKLRDAVADAGNRDTDLDREFRSVMEQGGVTWQPPTANEDTTSDEGDPRRPLIFDIVQAAGPGGMGPALIHGTFAVKHPQHKAPNTTVIARWLKADDRIHQPKYGTYAVKPEAGTS